MASTLRYFMLPEDERGLFRVLERQGVTLFPELVPPGYQGVPADPATLSRLEGEAWYLAVERMGPVIVHPIKRGPDRGMLEIEEIPSPVLHYERSLRNEAGELVGGRIWAELDVTDDPRARGGKHPGLHAIFEELHGWLRKTVRRSDPKGWWVGPAAARAWRSEGLVLREPGHRGGTVGVWR